MSQGVLLVNLGTPRASSKKAVRFFLKEFLSDERVIDLPKWLRLSLLYGVILPFRSAKTAQAYQLIWDAEKGSPLMCHSKSFAQSLQEKLGQDYHVRLAMRYGEPAIEKALQELLPQISSLTIIPLYPQYASSTTGSVVQKCFDELKGKWNIPSIEVWSDFYGKDWFISALVETAKSSLEAFAPDHTLLSFHGLPVRQIEKEGHVLCSQAKPCPMMSFENRFCYRAQCFQTARLFAESLEIDHYSVAFQSRLGRIPWIQPYIDDALPELIAKGVKRLAVLCPSFVTDCLETLEEIGIRLRQTWHELGGEDFLLVPALNDNPAWVDRFAQALKDGSSTLHKSDLTKVGLNLAKKL